MYRSYRILTLLLLSATLIGCATFKSPFDNTDPLTAFVAKPPRNGKGLVLLLVTPNSGKINWQQAKLSVRKLNARGRYSGRQIPLLPVSLSTSSETVAYVGKLFPGRYAVTEMSQTRLIDDLQAVTDLVGISKEGDADALEFMVESDKLTDVGRLLVTAAEDAWQAGWSSDRKAVDDIEQGNATLAGYLNGFVATAPLSRRVSDKGVQRTVIANPAGAFDIQRHPEQGIVAGSRFGAILRRDDKGEWQRSRVGRFQRVLSLAEGEKGQLLFAGEDNLLGYQFMQQQAVKFRYIRTKALPSGELVKVQWSDSRGLLVLHQDGETVRVFAAKTVKNPQWQLLAEVAQSGDVPEGVLPARLEVLGDYVALAVYPDTIVSSRSPGSEWVANTAPGEISDFQLRRGDLMRVLSVNRYSGSVTARDSATDGAGWRKLEIAPRTKVLPIMVEDYELSKRELKLDDSRIAATLLKQSNPDDRWRPVARMPAGKLSVIDGQHLFVVGAGFELVRTDDTERAASARDFVAFSADGGETWVREREH